MVNKMIAKNSSMLTIFIVNRALVERLFCILALMYEKVILVHHNITAKKLKKARKYYAGGSSKYRKTLLYPN